VRERARAWLPGLVALAVVLLIYSGTLQRDINGSGHSYMIDAGEIQVALNLWGTIHHTGYPLFTVLGAAIAGALRAVDLCPATAASAVSTIWSLLGLAGAYWLIARVTEGAYALAALATLALGLVETFWIHGVAAEVYSFSLFLTTATMLVGVSLADCWNERGDAVDREGGGCAVDGWDRRWLLAMLLLGMGVEHHRLLIILVPCVFLMAAPVLWQNRANWLPLAFRSVVAFALPFLAYLYLPLRASQGARWVYGQPGTWDGFWTEFTGRAVTPYLIKWPGGLAGWLENLRLLVDQMRHQLPAAVLLAGGAGLIWLTWRRAFWKGLGFVTGTLAFMAFVGIFPSAVWAPPVLMPSLLFLVLGLAVLLHDLVQAMPSLRWGAGGALLLLSLWLFRTNLPFIHGLVTDGSGRDVIHTLEPLESADLPGGRDVVALPWGGNHFAAAYGLYVTGELGGFELVDHLADFRSIVRSEGKVITLAFNLGIWPLEWWTDLLGEAHFSSAAPGVAMISRDMLYQDVPVRSGFDLGNGVRVRAAELFWEEADVADIGRASGRACDGVSDDGLRVILYWEAVRRVPTDYRVAVHLVANDPPAGAQDLLAQADSLNPVGGWYPTGVWKRGEIVRDDYVLTVPAGAPPVGVGGAI